jgi:signal transduction histidine kinase
VPQVLVVHSLRRDANISIVTDRELPRMLEAGLGQRVDYYSEYIDPSRFPDSKYQSDLRDFLQQKYKNPRFGVVIAMHDQAIEFVDRNRHELLPDTPVVFYARSPSTRRLENSTGVFVEPDFSGTLALATELQPEVRQVFVISGASASDQALERTARAQLQAWEPQRTVTYLSGLPTKELETRLSALPEHSIVYFLLVNRDGAGENFHPLAYLDRVVAAANAPVYSWVDSAIGHGIVGGRLLSQQGEMQSVGELALRVLRGERADDVPISTPDLNVEQVDWRQLRRWGISAARIPSGTLVRFREPTAWERYRAFILGGAALVLAQTALIAGLLVRRARRRRGEEQVDSGQNTLDERVPDLGARLILAQEAERSRIARELHDDVSQQVALLAIDLGRLSDAGGERRPEAEHLASTALDRVQSVARSVHDLSHRLHPAKLQLLGLVAALASLQRELSQPAMAITFSHDNVPSALPQDLSLCLFRIVQEALQNAAKHSGAHDVSVRLSGGADALALTIVDDGTGFDVDTAWGRGLGLVSMGERLEALGGALKIYSKPGAGTRLEVTVPIRSTNGAPEATPKTVT